MAWAELQKRWVESELLGAEKGLDYHVEPKVCLMDTNENWWFTGVFCEHHLQKGMDTSVLILPLACLYTYSMVYVEVFLLYSLSSPLVLVLIYRKM